MISGQRLVRAETGNALAMTKHPARRQSLKKKAEAGGRSDVYLWLKARHRHVSDTLRTKQPWQTIAQEMAADGVLTKDGVTPTRLCVRKAWVSLERNLAKEKEELSKAPPKPKRSNRPNIEPPSRPGMNSPVHSQGALRVEPPDWREHHARQEAPPTQPATGEGAPPAAPTLPKPTPSNGGRLTPAEVMANLERRLREADGPLPQRIVRGKII